MSNKPAGKQPNTTNNQNQPQASRKKILNNQQVLT